MHDTAIYLRKRIIGSIEKEPPRPHNPEVVGSNPAPATKNLQLVGLAGELFCYSGTVLSAQFPTSQTKSRSVTSRPDLGGQVLQIEIYRWVGSRLSKSVTRGTDFAELLLQIEILLLLSFMSES